MIDPNDDLASAKPPFKVVAVVPVHERLQLLPYTISRLLKKNGCHTVICVGDGIKEKAICLEAGAMWVPHQNKPLGEKWNAGFLAAKTLNPDAVIYSGSSDWLSNNWITTMKPHLDRHQMVGVPGCYLLDYRHKMRLCHWPGYVGQRADETIGIGRMLSRKLLDLINWKPFHDDKDASLDRSMKDKAKAVGITDYFVRDESLKAMAISTNRWVNMHKFVHHWDLGVLPSEKFTDLDMEQFLVKYFPEAFQFQKDL